MERLTIYLTVSGALARRKLLNNQVFTKINALVDNAKQYVAEVPRNSANVPKCQKYRKCGTCKTGFLSAWAGLVVRSIIRALEHTSSTPFKQDDVKLVFPAEAPR